MKVTVVKDSVIYNQTIYKKDESFECDDAIAISLLEREYVSIEGGEEVAQALTDAGIETLTVPFERAELELLDRAELVQLAKDLGVKANGKSEEIIERILEVHVDEEEDSESTDDMPATGMPE